MKRFLKYFLLPGCFSGLHLSFSQYVLYSPSIIVREPVRPEIAGETANHYWLLREKPAKPKEGIQQSFQVYTKELKWTQDIETKRLTEQTIKVYLVPGTDFFDRILLNSGQGSTGIRLQRFSEDGSALNEDRQVAQLHFESASDHFLICRSANKGKILLLCFEPVSGSAPAIHSLLFDANWNLISSETYRSSMFSQPMIQDDFCSYPVESFNSFPLQLADDGQWLMLAPSRIDGQFILYDFSPESNGFSFCGIKMPEAAQLEDLGLSINNELKKASAGLLSRFYYHAWKIVQVLDYSMENNRFDFDTAYRINTLPGNRFKAENLVKELFVPVPKGGFLLLREYGRSYQSPYEELAQNPVLFFTGNADNGYNLQHNSEGYLKQKGLTALAGQFSRGDLSIFYFPSDRTDSSWSALIRKAQTTEMNSPNLSYSIFPELGKMVLLYNQFRDNRGNQFGSSSILDDQGNLIEDAGVVYWKYNILLDFQRARQISEKELAVPYLDKQRKGFAIIRF
jgi:hypothetical protein